MQPDCAQHSGKGMAVKWRNVACAERPPLGAAHLGMCSQMFIPRDAGGALVSM